MLDIVFVWFFFTFFVGLMLGIALVCLSVSLLGDLCLALRLSLICGTYVGHWVCLSVFVGIMMGIRFVCLSVCWLGDLCLALRLSVICGTYVGH